jgi:hypothetical protein
VVVPSVVVVIAGLPLKASSYCRFHPWLVCQASGFPQQIPARRR